MIETINGKAYLKVGDKVYELGGGSNIITADSVEQLPDPASVPENTIAFVKSEGGGSESVSWNDLTDKPFYDDRTIIEWDGNTDGYTVVENGDSLMVKVSDKTPTKEDLLGGTYTFVSSDGEQTENEITEEAIQDLREAGVPVLMFGSTYVVLEDCNIGVELESGIYFGKSEDGGYSSCLAYGGEIKTIDPKYVPKEVPKPTSIDNGAFLVASGDKWGVMSSPYVLKEYRVTVEETLDDGTTKYASLLYNVIERWETQNPPSARDICVLGWFRHGMFGETCPVLSAEGYQAANGFLLTVYCFDTSTTNKIMRSELFNLSKADVSIKSVGYHYINP